STVAASPELPDGRERAQAEAGVAAVEAALAQQIGPLARVLVKKALKNATTLSALVSTLEENIPGDAGRRAFREAVRRLAT
ncbi:MAG TPA: hypothetical protein PK598_05320, partial [Thermoanaerobaculia bacterium]|nr:hypothetical protein [Thermoanaerobaculia bacterium]